MARIIMKARKRSSLEHDAGQGGPVGSRSKRWEEFSVDHLRLLYLIYCYTMIDVSEFPYQASNPH
eukprot:scaffold330279_cov50-Prasinocladus_malaysianus.AAC.1